MIIEPFDYSQVESQEIRAITNIIDTNDESVPHGLIMSKVSLSPAELERWRGLVNAMRADGTMLRIFEKYFKPDLARAMVNF
jgi:polar amino acid transport system substrate-binding protein